MPTNKDQYTNEISTEKLNEKIDANGNIDIRKLLGRPVGPVRNNKLMLAGAWVNIFLSAIVVTLLSIFGIWEWALYYNETLVTSSLYTFVYDIAIVDYPGFDEIIYLAIVYFFVGLFVSTGLPALVLASIIVHKRDTVIDQKIVKAAGYTGLFICRFASVFMLVSDPIEVTEEKAKPEQDSKQNNVTKTQATNTKEVAKVTKQKIQTSKPNLTKTTKTN